MRVIKNNTKYIDAWHKEKCRTIVLRINKSVNKDVLDFLESKNMQGTILKALRLLMQQEENS